MIDFPSFEREINKAAKMLREAITKDYVEFMFRQFKYLNEDDFYKGLTDLLRKKEKITFNNLNAYVQDRQWQRIVQERKDKINTELKEFKAMEKTYGKKQTCDRNQECGRCEQQNCSIYAQRSIKNIRDILSKRKTYKQVCREMSEEFPGCGLGTYIAEEVF